MELFFSNQELFDFSRSCASEEVETCSLEWFRRDNRNICIYGSGLCGQATHTLLASNPEIATRITGFLDSNPCLAGQEVANLPVFLPEDPRLTPLRPLVVLSVSNPGHMREMAQRCERLGYDHVPFTKLRLTLEPRISADWLESLPEARAAMDIWDDAESRDIYYWRVRLLANRDAADAPYTHYRDQYFPAFIPQENYRFFVDGGAYLGDTLEEYTARFGEIRGRYYMFEPDGRIFPELKRAMSDRPRTSLYNLALFDQRTTLRFHLHYDVGSSCVTEDGEVEIEAAPLDEVLSGCEVSFIKLDVEGAELEALAGAAGIIAEQRPTLAVCLYHRPEHLWTIPAWIKAVMPESRLYLRHYSLCQYETVCYAVPGEKEGRP